MCNDTGSVFKKFLQLSNKIFNHKNKNMEIVTTEVYKLVIDIWRN